MIIDLLLNSTLTYEEIREKTNCPSISIITHINMGYHYIDNKYTYPLRKKDIKRTEKENKQSKFYNNEEYLQEVIEAIKNPSLSYEEISNLYDISVSLLTLINNGKKYKLDKENYPLRKKNANQCRIFTQEEMLFIKEALCNTKMTMTEIAKAVNCGNRATIAAINKGIRQKQEDWIYPLR